MSPPLVFHKFEQDQFLWIVSLLDTYLLQSQSWKHGDEKTMQGSCKEYYCGLGNTGFKKFRC